MKNKISGRLLIMLLVTALITLFVFSGCENKSNDDKTAYEHLVALGYKGTEEQLIACLVGEQYGQDCGGDSAFDSARKSGFSGSFEELSEILTGTKEKNESKKIFQIATESGYKGTFTDFLSSLVKEPSKLGVSIFGNPPTEYEKAVSGGYKGSFIDWLIFLVK